MKLRNQSALYGVCTTLLRLEYRVCDDGTIVSIRPPRRGCLLVRRLPRKSRADFLSAPDSAYELARGIWRAVGSTVLLHPDYGPDLEKDLRLLKAVISFKKWFFDLCFRRGVEEGGNFPGIILAGNILKRLSAWLCFYRSCPMIGSEKPRDLSPFPGWDHTNRMLILPWFAGELAQYQRPWMLESSKKRAHFLAQTISCLEGLPCPPQSVLDDATQKCIMNLGADPKVHSHIVRAFKQAGRWALAHCLRKGGKFTTRTHWSLSTSGCYENPSGDSGGAQGYACPKILEFTRTSMRDLSFDGLPAGPGGFDLCDPLGRRVLSSDSVRVVRAIMEDGLTHMCGASSIGYNLTFADTMYLDIAHSPLGRISKGKGYSASYYYKQSLRKGNQTEFDDRLGDFGVLWAFSEMAEYGYWTVKQPCFRAHARYPLFWVPKGFEQSERLDLIGLWQPVDSFPVRMTTLSEPGWKARCLTLNKVCIQIIQSLLSHSMTSLFEHLPGVGMGFTSGYTLWEFLKVLEEPRLKAWLASKGLTISNADLSSATDRIPVPILRALYEGFTDHEDCPPVWRALMPFVTLPHDIFVNGKVIVHLCGSFLGESISFKGLTLYTLSVTLLTAFCVEKHLNPSDYIHQRWIDCIEQQITVSRGLSAQVGDDNCVISSSSRSHSCLKKVYSISNGEISPGKFFRSQREISLARALAWVEENGSVSYIDLIKMKYLVKQGRHHSDHRSGLLGRGTALSEVLEWITTDGGNQFQVQNAYNMYIDQLQQSLGPKVLDLLRDAHVTLPPLCGGMRLPLMSFNDYDRKYGYILDSLWFCITEPSIQNLRWLYRLRDNRLRSKRGAGALPLTEFLDKKLGNFSFSSTLPIEEAEVPESGSRVSFTVTAVKERHECLLYSCDLLLKEASELAGAHSAPRTSKGTIPLKWLVGYAKVVHNLVPVESLLDPLSRLEAFSKFFDGSVEPQRNNLFRYARSMKACYTEFSVFPGRTHGFTSFADITHRMRLANTVFIDLDVAMRLMPVASPTLSLDLSQAIRKRVSADTVGLAEAVRIYTNNIPSEGWH